MLCFPNAKINLGLNIIEKRNDGYHNIETVFYPVQWCDALEGIRHQPASRGKKKKKITISISGLKISDFLKNNLCVKAFDLLDRDFKLSPVKMHLHKNIPIGAGLGGGSSDGAFALKLFNEIFALKLNKQSLKKYAQQLGSDCSFFMENIPMFASGKGDRLEKINLRLDRYDILIAKPSINIATAEAYKDIITNSNEQSLKKKIQLPLAKWKNNVKNDFETTIFKKYPVIAEIKNKMYEQGAVYASMSGSGSAVYGIFEEKIYKTRFFKDCLLWEGKLH